jgi:ABC-2 type transport system permease protein
VIAVELRKLVRRPRTWVSIFLLVLLPTIVALFLRGTHVAPRPGHGTAFLAEVLTDGDLFPAAALAIVLPVFLPIAVATIAGESIAGEAASGTLRYLLIRPVRRTTLLVAKLVAVMVYVLLAVVIVAVAGYVLGHLLFGPGTATTISGTTGTNPGQASAFRTIAAVLYVGWSMLGVASVALFLSTFTESSLAASLGAIAVLVASGVLQALDAARSIQPYLPTRYWLSFIDLFREPILWRNVERGVALQAVYVVVLLAAAWANFTTRDIKA